MSTATETVFSPNALTILCRRYFQRGTEYETCERCGVNHETEEQFFDRVSFGRDDWRERLSDLSFLPNSPTLFNAGNDMGTLAACFVFHIGDSMESIMDVARKSAMVQKWGGGVGYSFSELRPKGTPISTTHGQACGPVLVLRMLNSVSTMITQAGKRDAAQMGVLSVEHPDVREFIHCKDEHPDELSSFNISVALTDDFMSKVEAGDTESRKLFHEMAESAWKTGDPGCLFIDTSNRTNPTPSLGTYSATNPCGEQYLLNDENCTLGSINLAQHVEARMIARPQDKTWQTEYSVDWRKLDETTRLATRYLDHVVDVGLFPIIECTQAAAKTRRIGLGVMGWADMLTLLRIPYDSDEALKLGDQVMKRIQETADRVSRELGREKGPYPAIEDGSGMRNAARTTVAPTGTISLLAGCSSGIEPHFSLKWTRNVGADISGKGITIEEHVPVVDRTDFVPHTAMEIDWQWHLKHQAVFQRHVDNSISKTINLRNDATVEEIEEAYFEAWKSGCKGVTIYRDGCREKQVLSEIDEEPEDIEKIRVGIRESLEIEEAGKELIKSVKNLGTTRLASTYRSPRVPIGLMHTLNPSRRYDGVYHKAMSLVEEQEPKNATFLEKLRTNGFAVLAKSERGLVVDPETHQHGRKKLEDTRQSLTHKFSVGGAEGYFTVGLYDDGSPGELFITMSKAGSTIYGLLDSFAVMVSISLQYGVPIADLTRKFVGTQFLPSGFTENEEIRKADSIIDYIFKWLHRRFIAPSGEVVMTRVRVRQETKILSGSLCIECGQPTVHEEGCEKCDSCRWTRC